MDCLLIINNNIVSREYLETLHFKNFKEIKKFFKLKNTTILNQKIIYDFLYNKSIKCICGKDLVFKGFSKGYSKYCSIKCFRNSEEYLEKSNKTKLQRYGDINYNNRTKCKETKFQRYNDENYCNVDKIKETKFIRYGDENYCNSEKIKESKKNINIKEMVRKIKETKIQRYGDENYNNIEKYKETCLERYGVEYSILNKEIKQKSIETLLKNYGVDHNFKIDNFYEKMKNSNLKKFGVENYMKSYESKKNIDIAREEYNKRINKELNKNFLKDNFISENRFDIGSACEYFFYSKSHFNKIKKKFNINELNIHNTKRMEYSFIYDINNLLRRKLIQQYKISFENDDFYVDGYDKETNTIYEFLGDYWHGNLKFYDKNHRILNGKTSLEAYIKTFKRFSIFKKLNFNVRYIWENEYKSQKLKKLRSF